MKMTPMDLFLRKYDGGCGSNLCAGAQNVCHARGDVPAEVLFIGEAPGEAEDALGMPFIGPAGKLLQGMVEEVIGLRSYCFTNLVGCIPRDEDGVRTTEPHAQEIKDCAERLRDFVDLCRPKLVVAVGGLAEKWVPKLLCGWVMDGMRTLGIVHPAAILRAPAAQKGFMEQRVKVQLRTALGELEA